MIEEKSQLFYLPLLIEIEVNLLNKKSTGTYFKSINHEKFKNFKTSVIIKKQKFKINQKLSGRL